MTFSTLCSVCFGRRRPRPLSAMLAAAALYLALVSPASAVVTLLEPDNTGLFQVEGVVNAPVLRDTARGWTYFRNCYYSCSVEGVAMPQWLFRINDAGLPDTSWRLPSDFQIVDQYLAPDGTPIVQAYVKNSPTYEKRWYLLTRESAGQIVPVEFGGIALMPARDAIYWATGTGLEPRLLPLGDGTALSFETDVAPAAANSVTSYALRKRNADNTALWSHTVGGRLANLATDTDGSIYLLGEAVSVGGKTANLLRLRSDGSVDAAWNPVLELIAGVAPSMRVVGDRIVIVRADTGTPQASHLTTLDRITGVQMSQREAPYAFGGIGADGMVMAGADDGRWMLLDSKRSDASGDLAGSARVGVVASISTSIRWNDGYVLGGNFLYWFDGKLYRNLMRVDASFRPDPAWTPSVDGSVAALAVDAQGRLIVGSNSTSGQQARLARFKADGTLDTSWHPVAAGDIYKILPVSDGTLFIGGAYSAIDGVARRSLARFRADGTLDPDWASQPSWPVMDAARYGQFGRDGIYRILDAGAEGVYFIWEDGYMNGSSKAVMRLSRDGSGATLPTPEALARGPGYSSGGGSMLRDARDGAIYAIGSAWGMPPVGSQSGTVLFRLLPPNMTVDGTWPTHVAGEYGQQFTGFAYQTASHIYVCRSGRFTAAVVRRFNKETGLEDPDWSSDETYLCDANAVERGSDGVTLVLSWQYGGAPRRFSATARNEARTVVEYYSRDSKRFFITGRPAEIALLDAMPTSFSRTGMQFAASTALVRVSDDALTLPVCRFYAAPEAGGSNSHFYGRDGDCTLLKRFAALRYEGYDFRAGVATGAGGCPSALPMPVYRLFNQQSASNNGNHRYVVSEARRSEMKAAGWADEGVAFCTSSATDSKPLAAIAP